MPYKYSLDSSSKKHLCPNCEKKRFVIYKNNLTNEFLPSEVGRCDREQSCGYHYTPMQYFDDNQHLKSNYENRNTTLQKHIPKIIKETSHIDFAVVKKSLKYYKLNNFVSYLNTVFKNEIVTQLCKQFKIGTSKYWNGATVFWQIDEANKVRSGKVMQYNKNTGKRTKNITWVHSILKLKDFNLKQCLYGLHQINVFPNKLIAIVESEKTAIIMTGLGLLHGIMKDYLWLATGSLNMLKIENLQALKNRNIVLYPDLGSNINTKGTPYEQWKQKSDLYKKEHFKITISKLLEHQATNSQRQNGEDIADFVISELKNKKLAKPEIQLSKEQANFDKLVKSNPNLTKFAEIFGLGFIKN